MKVIHEINQSKGWLIDDILTKNYSDGNSTFDEIEKQALEMADMMTYGITKQFPDPTKFDRFCRNTTEWLKAIDGLVP